MVTSTLVRSAPGMKKHGHNDIQRVINALSGWPSTILSSGFWMFVRHQVEKNGQEKGSF